MIKLDLGEPGVKIPVIVEQVSLDADKPEVLALLEAGKTVDALVCALGAFSMSGEELCLRDTDPTQMGGLGPTENPLRRDVSQVFGVLMKEMKTNAERVAELVLRPIHDEFSTPIDRTLATGHSLLEIAGVDVDEAGVRVMEYFAIETFARTRY